MSLLGTFAPVDESDGAVTSGTRTTVAGSLVVAAGSGWQSANNPTLALTSNQAGTYTEDFENVSAASGDNAVIALAHNIGGTRGAGHSLTNTGPNNIAVSGAEFDGIDSGGTPIVGTVATGTSASPSCSVTIPSGNATVVALVTYKGTATTIAVTNGTQATEADENSDNQAHNLAYKVGQSGTVTIQWSLAASRDWICRAVAFPETAGGPTTYPQTVSGAIAAAGALLKRAATAEAGTLPSSGAVLKQPRRALTGAIASAGALAAVKTVLRSLIGAIASAGSLVKQARTAKTGSLALAGALTKRPARAFTGTLSSAGALAAVRTFLKAVTGTLTSSGALVRRTGKLLTGVLNFEGPINGVKQVLHDLTGTLTSAGALTKQPRKVVSGTLTSAGVVVRRAGKVVAGAIASAASLATSFIPGGGGGPILQSLGGAIGMAGGLAKQTRALKTGALLFAGALVKRAMRSLTGALTPGGTVSKLGGKSLGGTLAPSGGLLKRLARTLLGSLTSAGALSSVLNGAEPSEESTPYVELESVWAPYVDLEGSWD